MTNRARDEASAPLATVDLGSNSFHLLLAAREGAYWRPLQRMGEKVQLAAGMCHGLLQPDAIERGLEALRRFQVLLETLPAANARIVGTYALREARNRAAFLEPAQALLQRPIEVISSSEEARLIYAAAIAGRPPHPRLVIDVGGGSTELVRGHGAHIQQLQSVAVGCLRSLGHFPQGRLDALSLQRARAAARAAFVAAWPVPPTGVEEVIGCSGTLLAVGEVLHCQGWERGRIERAGLARLYEAVLAFRRLDAVAFPGLCASRRSIFVSGLAVVQGLFDALGLQRIQLSGAALREGMMAALAGSPPTLALAGN